MKKALITGITGQDGSYLAELLLKKGYEVHGFIRHSSTSNTSRIDHLIEDPNVYDKMLYLYHADLSDGGLITKLVKQIRPDEVYNLASQSHVRVSFDVPEYTGNITGLGTLRVLEAIRTVGIEARFYQASSSELFGKAVETPQRETTPFHPRSPYACAKAYSFWITVNYREGYGFFACNGILFNHESPRRGETFVTRKITRALSRIKLGVEDRLYLGNMDAMRDWGYARDYVEAMWMMLQHDVPDDYCIATGEIHSVREFVENTAEHLGMSLVWKGNGINEKGIDQNTGKVIVEIDPRYFRPAEVDSLIGDASKAREKINWQPRVKFKELVEIMTQADYDREISMIRKTAPAYNSTAN
ncbi:MAG: GDP-mannose 4,6-dehydratase [Nitrospirae bacterium]|nr:GDP-mannose 4,6-dehydratase [Nitrospirota bacterium]MBF0592664.1 GDP-mannose 4,6-dehydratase [Nitrospirota bacterium]